MDIYLLRFLAHFFNMFLSPLKKQVDLSLIKVAKVITFIFFMALSVLSPSQLLLSETEVIDLPKELNNGYEGRHFILGFFQNEVTQIQYDKPVQMKLFFAANNKAAKVRTILTDGTQLENDVPANGVVIRDIYPNLECRTSEAVENKGIEVISDEPITVYGYSSQITTSDIFTAIPVSNLGTEYRVISMPNDFYAPAKGRTVNSLSDFERANRSGMFLVVAGQDGTLVDINTTAPTQGGKSAYQSFTITLNKGQTYLVKSLATPDVKRTNDLTGSYIKSNKPVSVFSGHARTSSPQVDFTTYDDSKNFLIEVLPPINTWGKEYHTAPYSGAFAKTFGTMYKVVAGEYNTVIDISTSEGVETITLQNPGDFKEVYNLNEGVQWSSSKPFLLSQFMTRVGVDDPFFQYFDPVFAINTPTNQFINTALFRTPKNNISNFIDDQGSSVDQYLWHRCMLIVEKDAISDITINGSKIAQIGNTFYSIGYSNQNYSYVIINLEQNKTYKIQSLKGKFAGIMYGGGGYDAYSNPLGSYLGDIKKQDETPPNVWADESCGNLKGVISDSLNTDLGLLSVKVLSETTNFLYTIETLTDTSRYISFEAHPIDRRKDGVFSFELRDKAGFGKVFRYEYTGVKFTQLSYKDLKTMFVPEKKCFAYSIRNDGDVSLTLEAIEYLPNIGIQINSPFKLPYSIKAKDSLVIDICVQSNANFTDYLERVVFKYQCEIEATLILEAKFKNPDLLTANYDFGLVRVGDTVCTDLVWYNKGDVPIIVTDLSFLGSSLALGRTIFVDTTGLFPVTLLPEDSLVLKQVCFSPDSSGNFDFGFTLNNNYNLPNRANVIGKGGAPNIHILNLDWGFRRLGTKQDTIINLINSGGYKGRIDSIIVNKTRDDSFVEQIIWSLKGVTLDPGEVIPLNLSYTAKEEDKDGYLVISKFIIDWKPHVVVNFEITAEATLPTISTRVVDMGTLFIGESIQGKDSLMFDVKDFSLSDSLNISKIWVIDGDQNVFSLSGNYTDLGYYKNNYSRLIDIKFVPKEIKNYILHIGIENDGLANYAKKIDTVTIIGRALALDTVSVTGNFTSNIVYACDSTDFVFELKNLGNKDISVKDIKVYSNNFDVWTNDDLKTQFTLKASENKKYNIGVIAERGEEGFVTIEANCTFERLELGINKLIDSIIVFQQYIRPKILTLNVDKIDNLLYTIGDTAKLKVSGTIPYDIDKDLNIRMSLKVDLFQFTLRGEEAELIITSDQMVQKAPVSLTQTLDEVILDISLKDIFIGENTKWEINFVFMKMLNQDLNPNFTFEISGDRCFDPYVYNFSALVKEVCVINLRSIQLFTNLTELKTSPNPISNFMKVDFMMPVDDEKVKFVIYSLNGEKIQEFGKFNLKKGEQSVIFELMNLSSMNYILSLEATQFIQQTLFTVYR